MAWNLVYAPNAVKELAKLDKSIQRNIKKYLHEACQLDDPADRGHPLTGPWSGFQRYRIGQIRLIVSIERQIITISVIKIDRRDSIY